jgi:hypothetical protein
LDKTAQLFHDTACNSDKEYRNEEHKYDDQIKPPSNSAFAGFGLDLNGATTIGFCRACFGVIFTPTHIADTQSEVFCFFQCFRSNCFDVSVVFHGVHLVFDCTPFLLKR